MSMCVCVVWCGVYDVCVCVCVCANNGHGNPCVFTFSCNVPSTKLMFYRDFQDHRERVGVGWSDAWPE